MSPQALSFLLPTSFGLFVFLVWQCSSLVVSSRFPDGNEAARTGTFLSWYSWKNWNNNGMAMVFLSAWFLILALVDYSFLPV